MATRLSILALCISTLLPSATYADMLPGTDDPAYIAAIAMALTTDDPRALRDLHALATAGNSAALVALPTVERWIPRAGSLAERAEFRKINGVPVIDLANQASPVARLWLQGAVSDNMAVQLERATALYALGETSKAEALLRVWLNQTGGFGALPAGFADLTASAWLKAAILEARLNPFIGNPTPDVAGDMTILTAWLAADRIEGWMVLARATGQANRFKLSAEATAHGDALLALGLAATPPDLARQANARMTAATLVWNAPWLHAPNAPVTSADVQTIWVNLSPHPAFAPVALFCDAACPDDPAACERAYIQAFGYQNGNSGWYEPQSEIISAANFYASPRAAHILVSDGISIGLGIPPDQTPDPATILAIPSLAAAAKSDACFAASVTRVLTTPLPGAP